MKVLLVLNKILSDQIGGIELYTSELSKELCRNEIQAKILIPNFNKSNSSFDKYEKLDVIRYAEPSIIDRNLIMGFRKPEGLKSFINHILTEEPDIIHFHEIAGSNGITIHHVEAAKKSGAKILMTFHLSTLSCMTGTLLEYNSKLCDGKIELFKCSNCYLSSKKINEFQRFIIVSISYALHLFKVDTTRISNRVGTALGTYFLIEKKKNDLIKLIKSTDKIIVVSNWYKKILLANGINDNKILSISQGLPIMNFKIAEGKYKIDKIKFIFVGRISHFKGVHLLIEAFQQLDSNNAELHIYGQADSFEYEFSLMQKTLNTHSVQWKGALSNKEIVKTMSDYNALCLPSTTSEMSPLVIQEAFAAGLPVIASNVYGNAEQIKHGVNGLLFNFNDPDDLLKQLKRCIDEKDLLPNLSSNILSPRSFQEVANEHIKLYNSLLS